MKKVAIFTWHNNGDCNYGQILQAFALQKKINELGVYSTIVDYIYLGKKIYHNRLLWPVYKIYDGLRNGKLIDQIYFSIFATKNMILSPRMFSFEEITSYIRKKQISNFLLGSDQIWNPQSGDIPKAMLLDFGYGIRGAYSPSMCSMSLFDKYTSEIRRIYDSLDTFDFIGLREESSVKMISSFGETPNIAINVDPVFLFDSNEWLRLLRISNMQDCASGYVLVYCVGMVTKNLIEHVNRNMANKEVRIIYNKKNGKCPSSWRKYKHVDIKEFIKLIVKADYILCDSFHMVAFSIIFRKQFSVFSCLRNDFTPNIDRIQHLLERTRLLNRLENVNCPLELIDYSSVEILLNKQIADSENFLKAFVNACR